MLAQLLNSTDIIVGAHLQVIYSRGEDIGRRLQKTVPSYVRDADLQF